MEIWNMILTNTLPEQFVPEEIQVPGFFLQQLSTPEGIRIIRILCIFIFLGILFGVWHYGKRASQDKNQREEEE